MPRQQLLSWRSVDGQTSQFSGYSVRPQAQALRLETPLFGFVWNRPLAVVVQANGVEERIPIVDATRLAVVTIYACVGLLTILFGSKLRAQRKSRITKQEV